MAFYNSSAPSFVYIRRIAGKPASQPVEKTHVCATLHQAASPRSVRNLFDARVGVHVDGWDGPFCMVFPPYGGLRWMCARGLGTYADWAALGAWHGTFEEHFFCLCRFWLGRPGVGMVSDDESILTSLAEGQDVL